MALGKGLHIAVRDGTGRWIANRDPGSGATHLGVFPVWERVRVMVTSAEVQKTRIQSGVRKKGRERGRRKAGIVYLGEYAVDPSKKYALLADYASARAFSAGVGLSCFPHTALWLTSVLLAMDLIWSDWTWSRVPAAVHGWWLVSLQCRSRRQARCSWGKYFRLRTS